MASSWMCIDPDSPFSLANIPFEIISAAANHRPRPATVIGDFVLDLHAFTPYVGFQADPKIARYTSVFLQSILNAFASLGQSVHQDLREYLKQIFSRGRPYRDILETNHAVQKLVLFSSKELTMHMPMAIGDYTDFYAGKNYAYNVGVMFRGPDNALQLNYTHLPIGYHGRASSIVISGTEIKRPKGQILVPGSKAPIFSSCKKMDIELEMAAVDCKENHIGSNIAVKNAKKYIFGLALMNDGSARDIQAWEYVPLGPFLSKSFATTISPWIVLSCALEQFLTVGIEPGNRTSVLPYLQEDKARNVYDIDLAVSLSTPKGHTTTIARTNAKHLLYGYSQMLAHHTINGCPLRIGDLLGSGTISGDTKESFGSSLEQSQNGQEAITIGAGETRFFLEDGDEVTIRGRSGRRGNYVGFGDCVGRIVP